MSDSIFTRTYERFCPQETMSDSYLRNLKMRVPRNNKDEKNETVGISDDSLKLLKLWVILSSQETMNDSIFPILRVGIIDKNPARIARFGRGHDFGAMIFINL